MNMELIKVQSNQVIASKKDKVKDWYLIQEGTVIQKFGFSEVKLGRNAIIGILESDRFLCDYIAGEDTVLAAFACENCEDLKKILAGQEKLRKIFLKAALEQRNQMFEVYANLYNKSRKFHTFVENTYNQYEVLCNKFKIELNSFTRMEHFNPLEMKHKAEEWEIKNSISLVKKYLVEYLQLMEKDDSLTLGAIMEASAQMRRVTLGINEMEYFLAYNKDIIMSENENDIFKLYFNLAIDAYNKKFDILPITEQIYNIGNFVKEIGIYNVRLASRRISEYDNYDFDSQDISDSSSSVVVRRDIDITAVDCMDHILRYAGYNNNEIEEICSKIQKYKDLPDMHSTDEVAYKLRRSIVPIFYDIYQKVFMKAVKDENSLTPILEMFLNFGFMDMELVGEEKAKALYDMTAHMDICHSENIYTIYTWLKAIYHGEKEPSKNEFDMDYTGYLAEMRTGGKITKQQEMELRDNCVMKVEYEIKNMFATVNKTTYGKITSFCPILNEYDLLNSIDKMLVTAEKLENALNDIRKVDYSLFYREVSFSDPQRGINKELIMKEILPDIILMPNAGLKAMMWQETAGIKRDTPGRFMFPIFTSVDLSDMMLETVARFRWEMCRKIQGVHWNDIRDKSLTAEYCAYIQFYRKNNDLSAEAKEKVKSTLTKVKNNYREVFVKDYVSWIKFESKGSFRLNKISRDILIRYCPFVKNIRNELKINPMYQMSIQRFDIEVAKKLQRYKCVYEKYQKSGGVITQELKDNILYYQM